MQEQLIKINFYFNKTTPTMIYTLSLHDSLPILKTMLAWLRIVSCCSRAPVSVFQTLTCCPLAVAARRPSRSEEHTSELQSLAYLVCRLLLEKKNHHAI